MADHEHPEMPDGGADADEAMVRELAMLGVLLQRRARAEGEPPSHSFVESLWARLVHDEGLDTASDDASQGESGDDNRDQLGS